MENITACIVFEHRFWLQILGDHSRFIYVSLSPKETSEIETARCFIKRFDELLEIARRRACDLRQLTEEAWEATKDLREFKLHLLRRHLVDGIEIHLSPTFINHMVNELEEYGLILQSLLNEGKLPACHPVHYHHIWLLDAVGHAGTIYCELDSVENELKQKSKCFEQTFEGFHQKAMEFQGYLRTCLDDFPALYRFNCQVNREMGEFMGFLAELVELRIDLQALGTLAPLAPDHMWREECYYLTKLAQAGAVPAPDCDPAKPRLKE